MLILLLVLLAGGKVVFSLDDHIIEKFRQLEDVVNMLKVNIPVMCALFSRPLNIGVSDSSHQHWGKTSLGSLGTSLVELHNSLQFSCQVENVALKTRLQEYDAKFNNTSELEIRVSELEEEMGQVPEAK